MHSPESSDNFKEPTKPGPYKRTVQDRERPSERELIEQVFTEDNLKQLGLEDYVTLLRTFPSDLVTHVTRHGFRDHTGHPYHTAGMGELHHGLEQMLEDGLLKSNLARNIEGGIDVDSLEHVIGLRGCRTKRQALSRLASLVAKHKDGLSPWYPDRAAVHVATGADVANSYYGAEAGNESFVIYPGTLLVAEGRIGSGHFGNATGGAHNDMWWYPRNPDGVSLDAGILFLPADAQVDPETGSRYRSDAAEPGVQHDGQDLSPPLAEQTIPSRDYWETYFNAHPEQRPSKLVYYHGEDPTTTLHEWLAEQRIPIEAHDQLDLREMFPDHFLAERGLDTRPGQTAFVEQAQRVIAEYFADETPENLERMVYEDLGAGKSLASIATNMGYDDPREIAAPLVERGFIAQEDVIAQTYSLTESGDERLKQLQTSLKNTG